MSSVLVCREALEDSVLGTLALARSFAKQGHETSVVFTGEALNALDSGTFEWSRNFKTRETQARVIAGAVEMGLALSHPNLDSRWSDIRSFVASFAGEAGVRLLLCPIWAKILNLKSAPDYLEQIDENELVDLLQAADTIVGAY